MVASLALRVSCIEIEPGTQLQVHREKERTRVMKVVSQDWPHNGSKLIQSIFSFSFRPPSLAMQSHRQWERQNILVHPHTGHMPKSEAKNNLTQLSQRETLIEVRWDADWLVYYWLVLSLHLTRADARPLKLTFNVSLLTKASEGWTFVKYFFTRKWLTSVSRWSR